MADTTLENLAVFEYYFKWVLDATEAIRKICGIKSIYDRTTFTFFKGICASDYMKIRLVINHVESND